jgi:hypothetical protein
MPNKSGNKSNDFLVYYTGSLGESSTSAGAPPLLQVPAASLPEAHWLNSRRASHTGALAPS